MEYKFGGAAHSVSRSGRYQEGPARSIQNEDVANQSTAPTSMSTVCVRQDHTPASTSTAGTTVRARPLYDSIFNTAVIGA